MKKQLGLKVGATTAFSAVMMLAATASAFEEQRNRTWGDSFGDSDAKGTLRYTARQRNAGGKVSVSGMGTKYIATSASQGFEASATVNGKKFTALSFEARALARWSQIVAPFVGEQVLTQTAVTELVFFGSETFGSESACGSNEKDVCSTFTPWSTSGKKEIVNTTVWVGPFPVGLRARLGYALGVDLTSQAGARKYLGLSDSLLGSTRATNSAYARLMSDFWICPGNCVVIPAGAKFDVGILSVSVSPTTSGRLSAAYKDTSDAKYTFTNSGPATIRTLDGKVSLTVDLGFDDYTWNIIDWDGYSWTKNLWADTGSGSCTDWTLDLTTCQDIVND